LKKHYNSRKKSEPTSKRAKSRCTAQRDTKEVLAELVGTLKEKLDRKKAIPRFKRRCSDRNGNTRSKSKAGRSGKGSCTDCRTVLYASPNHKLENFNERNRLVTEVTDSCAPALIE
jgi:hypothetical protein